MTRNDDVCEIHVTQSLTLSDSPGSDDYRGILHLCLSLSPSLSFSCSSRIKQRSKRWNLHFTSENTHTQLYTNIYNIEIDINVFICVLCVPQFCCSALFSLCFGFRIYLYRALLTVYLLQHRHYVFYIVCVLPFHWLSCCHYLSCACAETFIFSISLYFFLFRYKSVLCVSMNAVNTMLFCLPAERPLLWRRTGPIVPYKIQSTTTTNASFQSIPNISIFW